MPISGECEHGQLARQCPFCEYEAEISDLEKKIERMDAALEKIGLMANITNADSRIFDLANEAIKERK